MIRAAAVVAIAGLLTARFASADPAHIVAIKGFKYDPPELVVRPGEQVMWKNLDTVPHTVTSDAAGIDSSGLDSGKIAPGASWTWTAPNAPGAHPYHCTLHPNMKARLTIAPAR